jgi:hypothetical protein
MAYMSAAGPSTILALLRRIDELELEIATPPPTRDGTKPLATTCKHSTMGGEGSCVLCLRKLLDSWQAVVEGYERDLARVEKERDYLLVR